MEAFLAAYRELGGIRAASKVSNVSTTAHYRWLRTNEQYAKDFAEAQRASSAVLEEEARRRAMKGTREPIYFKSECVGYKRRFSDTLLIFLLKANNPSKFGDKLEQTNKGGISPVQIYLPENNRNRLTESNGSSNGHTNGRH